MLEKVYKQIDIEKISANENQPRTVFDDEKIGGISSFNQREWFDPADYCT